MKWFFIISGISILTFPSCRTIRSASSSNYERKIENTSETSHYEQLYFSLRDSVMNIKAPVEKSESRGLQHSELETSLARSTAAVDSAGSLIHSIENKDSIPTKVIYRDKYHIKYDTVYINRADTLTLTKTEYLEKGLSAVQRFQIRGFWVLILCVMLFVSVKISKQPFGSILKFLGKWIGLKS